MLTSENYYSRENALRYMGATQYKGFMECELRECAKLGLVSPSYEEAVKEDKVAFIFGSYIHSYFEGAEAFEKFKASTPELYKKNGEMYAAYLPANAMIKTLEEDPRCMAALSGKKEVIITFEFAGAIWKGRIDNLNIPAGFFSDLKSCKSISEIIYKNGRRMHFTEAYGYDTSMTLYRYGLLRNYYIELSPKLVCIAKEEPHRKLIVIFDDYDFNSELDQIAGNVPRILALKRGYGTPAACGKCEYCKAVEKVSEAYEFTDLVRIFGR